MRKIKKILVPMDYSSNSLEALKYAAGIALKNNCVINLLNVIPNPHYVLAYPDYGITSAHIIKTQQELINSLMKNSSYRLINLSHLKYLKGVNIKSNVITGNSVYQEIVDFAEDSNSDIIIMSTRGTTSLKKIFLGSNAERVIRLTSKPVLAVSRKVRKFKLNKIVFASDFSTEAYTAYPVINSVIKPFNAYIHLLKINSKNNFEPYISILNSINKFSKRFSGKFIPRVRASHEIDEGIANYAKSVKADLIVLGVHRKKAVSRLLGNRILEGILRLTNIPVLAVDIP